MPPTPARAVAIGDPQAPASVFFAVLERQGLLAPDGDVRGDRCLVSLGDHFDYPPSDEGDDRQEHVGREGLRILSWIGRQLPERTVLLLGNHDASRVVELIALDDERFAAARRLAAEIAAAESDGDGATAASERDRFARVFPEVPTPGLARRDFASYSEAQRDLVQQLLLGGRFRLAVAARLAAHPDVEVLVTHSAVTRRELALLGIPNEHRPRAIAVALNDFLDRAVERVRPRWQRGEKIPLDLAPLHVAGTSGREGGGLLYHRPANQGRDDAAWAFDQAAPRRFDPRELPRGLVQACGHTPPRKLARELGGSIADDADAEHGFAPGLLSVRAGEVRYGPWRDERPPADRDSAALLLFDGGMHHADPAAYPALALELAPDDA